MTAHPEPPPYEGAESFVTRLGCTVSVRPAPRVLGPGVLLCLDMRQPGDGRHAEVFLTDDDQAQLMLMMAK